MNRPYKDNNFDYVSLSYSRNHDSKTCGFYISSRRTSFYNAYNLRWDKNKEQWIVWRNDRLDEDIIFYTNANTKH